MRRLLITATIAALALSATAEAKPHNKGNKAAARRAVAVQQLQHSGRTHAAVAPVRNRAVARNYYRGSRYYHGGGYYPYHNHSGTSISIGIGAGYPGYYGYGYGYPYGYGGYNYGYAGYGYAGNGGVVANVQVRLARRGYYHGSVDGVAGPRTRSAIARYEANHGLIADGRIDGALLRSLGLS